MRLGGHADQAGARGRGSAWERHDMPKEAQEIADGVLPLGHIGNQVREGHDELRRDRRRTIRVLVLRAYYVDVGPLGASRDPDKTTSM
jgi:hypothetical protein